MQLSSESSETVEDDSIHPEEPDKLEDTVSVADIFADTDIIPFSSQAGDKSAFFD